MNEGQAPASERQGAAAVVAGLWTAMEGRHWSEVRAALHDDFTCDLVATGERFASPDAWVAFNRRYPGDWHITVLRIIADGNAVVSEVRVTVDGRVDHAASFFTIDGNRVAAITEYWLQPGAEPPPAWRADLSERIP